MSIRISRTALSKRCSRSERCRVDQAVAPVLRARRNRRRASRRARHVLRQSKQSSRGMAACFRMEWKTHYSGRSQSPRGRNQNGQALLSPAAYIILAAGWLVWFLPFPLTGWDSRTPDRRDNRARWGLLFEVIAYLLLWQGKFWAMAPEPWRIACSILFLALAPCYPGPPPEPWDATSGSMRR